MSLVVDFRLSGEPIGVTAAKEAVPDVTLEIQQWRETDGLVFWFIWARGEDLDRVTRAFEDLDHSQEVVVMNDAGSVRLYRVTIVPNVEPPMDLAIEGTLTEGYIEEDCLRLSGRCTTRDVLVGTWNYLRSEGISVSVESLRRPKDDEGSGRLTDGQFEALVTAYEMGYFDESTSVTQAEVAEELGIARSSLSSRLRRAEEVLVRQELGR